MGTINRVKGRVKLVNITDIIYGVPIAVFGVSVIVLCIITIAFFVLALKHILGEHINLSGTQETDTYNELKGYPNSAVMDEEDEEYEE